MYRLYHMPGWGSAIVDLQMEFYGLECERIATGDLFDDPGAAERLRPVNPRAQLPTLVLPDGQVMTESAAITLHLADVTGRDDLVPGPAAGERAAFLRWLVYLVANVYPTFTYADAPERFVAEAEGAAFRARVLAYRKTLWREVEAAARGPWFLGARFTALDIYLAVMTRWSPRDGWFGREVPKICGIGQAAGVRRELAAAFRRNFG